MLNILSSLWGKVLIIAAGSAFALAGAFFLLWSSTSERLAESQADLALSVAANEANVAAIDDLRREADTLDRLLVEASERERAIRSQANARRSEITDLARENDDVQTYLDSPVPDALRGLLNPAPVDEDGDG